MLVNYKHNWLMLITLESVVKTFLVMKTHSEHAHTHAHRDRHADRGARTRVETGTEFATRVPYPEPVPRYRESWFWQTGTKLLFNPTVMTYARIDFI